MGIRFKLSNTYRTEVNFAVFDEKGKRENFSFTAEFKRLDTEQVKDLFESARAPGRTDKDILRDVLVGWAMVDLDSKDPVPFTVETFDEFCAIPGAAGIAATRFFETVGGARQGN